MTDQRVCNKCGCTKLSTDFRNNSKSGRVYKICKSCQSEYDRLWRQNNILAKRENTKRDYLKNKPRYHAAGASYRARKSKSQPSWLTQSHKLEIRSFYEVASWYDVSMHVDHIVPLKGVNVCGLHVPWNLQILEAKDNLMKYNKEDNT